MRAFPEATVYFADEHVTLASWRDLVVIIWKGETRVEAIERSEEQLALLAPRFPGGLWMLTIVEEQAPAPAADARQALSGLLARAAPFVRCSSVVFEGSSFRASLVRSVVSTLVLLSRIRFPHRVFGTLEQAVAHYEQYRGDEPALADFAEIPAVVAGMRAVCRAA